MAPSVPEFYKGKSILITGSTGFVGKALVEKLLRSCPEVDTIYLLLRPKKGLNSEERLRDLSANKIFENLREKTPDVFKKLKLVAGDILDNELGISPEDKIELQERCNIILHSAACVRFDLKLKDAIDMNTRGTLRVLELAESMKNLQVLVHLSTAYCRCYLDEMEEKLYPPAHKPRKIMDIVEWMDDDTLKYLEPKLIASEPNTYSYTKAITEDLIAEYGDKFPIAIARPSIVTSAWKEPIPGWVDNLNGATGLLIGGGKGVIRTMHCEPTYTVDAIAVDIVVNACLLIAYVTALDKPKKVTFYNVTLSRIIKITWGEIIKLGEKWVDKYPHTVALWHRGGTIKSYYWHHQICVFFYHIIPAYLVDGILFLMGRKTFLINVQKRISHGLGVLQYYTTKEWYFKNDNFKSLRTRVSKEDNEAFYTDLSNLNANEYLRDYILGARQFCCKEDPSTIPRARKLAKIRYVLDVVVQILFYGILAWIFYSNLHIITSSVHYLDDALKSLSPINKVNAEEFITYLSS
ncbi:putative fatty acyl-CoA reductase CG5065 [Galleria mellonella]|uniref:Fatty acyl-CoA reductase n=1 Tax=Galleria mellonella TaxID=7137 RepID=A0A6J3BWF2_GALME|nr:putative fatty acyl-CoA reductase CG5065 [Galleria mellonella]